MLNAEVGILQKMGAEFRLGVLITRELFQDSIRPGFDAIILATGTQTSNVTDLFGIQPGEQGVLINKKTFTTSIPGVFACGNIIREQKLAVHSSAQGKMAATRVEVYLGTHIPGGIKYGFNSVTGHLFEPEWKEYLQESSPDMRVNPAGGFISGLTRDEAILEAKRCLHCDCRKPVSCKLRQYADEYGASRKRFAGPVRKLLTRSVQHELVVYETEKCIRCGLCVEISGKHGESIGLTYAGRGFDVRIAVPFNKTMKEALTRTAGECVEACPTGALAFKNQEERNPK
jgi:NAD-dependent dihydropyrimidine dehydrogenase PreA subunit